MVFLIVDDSTRFRQIVAQYLRENIRGRHKILEASDGGEAVLLYNRLRPDWVLMDIAMEPIDGLNASRAILRAHPGAKIVILTNYNDPDYRDAAKIAGTAGFVLKERLSDLIPFISTHYSRGAS